MKHGYAYHGDSWEAYDTQAVSPIPQFAIDSLSADFFHNVVLAALDTIDNKPLPAVARLRRLRELTLADCSIVWDESVVTADSVVSDKGIAHLEALKELRRLTMRAPHISDASLEIIGGFTELEQLELDASRVTDRGLARLKDLRRLKHLSLKRLRVTDEGLRHLAELTGLEELQLSSPTIDGTGLDHLQGL